MELALIYAWINFILFIGALVYFLREPVRDFLGDRSENLRKELDELRQKRQQMELHFSHYRKKMGQAEDEIKKLIEELQREGELEKQNLLKKSQIFSQKIKEDGQKMGEQELAKSKRILKKKTLLLAFDLAKKQLQNTVQADDQNRLTLWAIQNLESLEI